MQQPPFKAAFPPPPASSSAPHNSRQPPMPNQQQPQFRPPQPPHQQQRPPMTSTLPLPPRSAPTNNNNNSTNFQNPTFVPAPVSAPTPAPVHQNNEENTNTNLINKKAARTINSNGENEINNNANTDATNNTTAFAPAALSSSSSTQQQQHQNQNLAQNGNVEFFPRTPLYNDRVIPLGIIALLPLIPAFGSFPVAVVAVVGMALTYLADMMNFRRTTIALLVATLLSIWVGFYLGNIVEVWNSVAAFVVLLNAALLMCLLAVWALIHVRWVVLKFPEVTVRCERVVVGLLPFAALPSLVSTCAALAGSKHASFLAAFGFCVLHWLFFWRRPSSFSILATTEDTSKDVRDICFVVHRPETLAFSAVTLLLPTVLHCCFVWPTVSRPMLAASSIAFSRWLLFVNLFGLLAIPTAYFFMFHVKSLWFLRETKTYFFIDQQRTKLGIASYLLGLIFGVARLMHSRYSFYFVGFPAPMNTMMLILIGVAIPVLVLLSLKLYNTVNEKKENTATKGLWSTCLALSAAIVVAFCMTLGMPPFFVMTSASGVAALWAYLIDRKRNAGQYTMFMFCASLALLWWMFMSFSFIVSDLKVFGEMGVIPAPLLAGSMLWVFIFGLWLVPLSFQKEAKMMFTGVLIFHSQKILWIERVLYSQNEESTYPPQFVILTSIVGSLTAYRIFKNGVLTAGPASVVMGAYLSKIIIYFSDSVEIDYRWGNGSSATAILREAVLSYAAWAGFSIWVYCYMAKLIIREKKPKAVVPASTAAGVTEEGARKSSTSDNNTKTSGSSDDDDDEEAENKMSEGDRAKRSQIRSTMAIFSGCNWLFFYVAASPTLVRWFIEDIIRVPNPSRLQLIGCALVLGTLHTWYMVSLLIEDKRAQRVFAALTVFYFAAAMLDPPVEALVTDVLNVNNEKDYREEDGVPLRTRQHLLLPDLPFQAPWWSRWMLLLALGFGLLFRGTLAIRVPNVVMRMIGWTILGVLLGMSVTGSNIIIADWTVYATFSVYFVLTLFCLDQAHYNSLEDTEICVSLFIAALITFVLGVFLLNRVDVFSVTKIEAFLLDGLFASRVGAIGVLAINNFAFAATLKCRTHGFSLLPRPKPIADADALAQLSLVLTSACALGAVSLILMSMLLGEGSTPLILLAGGILLLVEDRGWGFGLDRGMRRYVIPFITVSLCLWVRAVQELFETTKYGSKFSNVLPYAIGSALCVPSQLIVSIVLWRGGSSNPNTVKSAAKTARGLFALALLVIDLLVVIMTVSTNLRLIAALNLIGHITRLSLFEGIFVRVRETIL